MKIEYSKKAVKYISFVDKSTKKHLRETIEEIPPRYIKRIQGIKNGYRLRVGDCDSPHSQQQICEKKYKNTGAYVITCMLLTGTRNGEEIFAWKL